MDVVISNCAINLSGDKDRVLSEAFRVLKLGGRFAVSARQVREKMLLWAVSRSSISSRGLSTTLTRVPERAGNDVDAIAPQVEENFMSAFIRATKPARCCAPDCCA